MAIQLRRGAYENYDASKLKPAEVGVVQSGDPNTTDGKAIYIAINANDVKRIPTAEEMSDHNDEAQAILDDIVAKNTTIQQVYRNTVDKANEASQSATNAETAKTAAEKAKTDTQALLNQAQTDIEGYTADAQQDIQSALTQAQTAISQQATTVQTNLQTAVNTAIDNIDDKEDTAINAINKAYSDRVDDIDAKIDQMIAVKTNAETVANAAKNKADALENDLAEVSSKVDRNTSNVNNLGFTVDSMIHGWYVDVQKRLIFTDVDGNPIGEPIEGIGGGGGGGGGGSSTNADMTAENVTGWISNSVSIGTPVSVKIQWSSIENNLPTGNGTATITVNNIQKAQYEVPQGTVTIPLDDYIGAGSNKVKITLTDVYDQSRVLSFNISVIDLRITSSFSTATPFEGTIPFSYTPIGEVAKTIYFKLDGAIEHTQQTSVSNRQLTYTFPAQSHGAHTLEVYFEAEVNNQTVRSNTLYYEFISIETLNDDVIIVSPFNKTSVTQYDSVVIPYTVYDPVNAMAEVNLSVNNTVVSTITVDRSEQSFTFRADTAGAVTFKIQSGETTKTIQFTVTELDIDVEAETDSLMLYLSSQGRSNGEANPETWTYNNISTTFTNFNKTNDLWQSDANGITVCRVTGNARLNIGYQPFATDFKTSGKTIEFEFATHDVLNYDSPIISCMSGNRGFEFTAQKVTLKSQQSEISTQYKEDEKIRIAFVTTKSTAGRMIYVYINGILSRAVQYPTNDSFSQPTPVNISIGSNNCTTDIYCIRIYDSDLNSQQVLNNRIADTQIGSEMLALYRRNDVFDAYGNIVVSKLPSNLPYMIIECAELPQSKGDKKTCSGSFTNPNLPSKSFTFTNCQIDVQGTSSQYYRRKNYKMKFKGGFTTSSGTAKTYAMRNDSIPTNTFTMKADVASSEGANNVELVRLYNSACPYKTPAQEANPNIRQGIDGFPMVIFWHDTELDTTTFLGKYNFNNDKGTEEVFGLSGDDESIEIKNNTGLRVRWKSADYSGTDYLNDFEWRFPDTDPPFVDATQLAEFASWVVSTDTTAATGDALPEPVTYDSVTYTNDTAEYRLAKFKNEAWDYMEQDSTLFYYLFTELFLMVDSRAKNAFPSFIGEEVVTVGN